jgi:cytochrome d ubiquinol oxidase subunit II
METVWYLGLGGLFAVYFALAGYDYGVGLLLPWAGGRRLVAGADASGDTGRRATLNALGPFFLGNEVWLVASAGVLLGAFPRLEGELLSGHYPAVAVALAGVIAVIAAVQLRSRPTRIGTRHAWDFLIAAASALAAGGWGAVLGGLLAPAVAVAGGVAMVALAAAHGCTFLALRLAPDHAAGYARLARRLIPVALIAVGAATVVAAASSRVRDAVRQPVPAVLLLAVLVLLLVLARGATARQRPGLAFAGTAAALALPVLIVGVATYPYALAPDLTVSQAAADPATLRVLSWLAIPLLPAMLGFQFMCWWAFRGRIDPRAPIFY